MSTPSRTLLLLSIPLLLLVVGAVVYLTLPGGPGPETSAAIERAPGPAGPVRAVPELEPAGPLTPQARVPRGGRPLEVELELVLASGALVAEGELALGAGARARLRGSLNGGAGEPLAGRVRFVAGTNQGRVLETDGEGRLGANDLHPGLQIVEVEAPGTVGALREIRLRNNAEEQLNIGFGMPALVQGRVVDTAGNPISGAEVILDGQRTTSDVNGEFHYPRVAPGHRILALVKKQGFARFRRIVPITAGGVVTSDRLHFVLEPGCDLQVTIQERIGADTQAQLFLLPDVEARAERKFPWHEVNPTPIHAGGTFVIEDLPAGTVQLALYHQGARATARISSVHLVPGRRETAVLHLTPAPRVTGRVLRNGRPVHRALVTLSAPDPAMASVRALGQPLAYLETAVLPLMPPGVQKAYSGVGGDFVLSGYWDSSPVRYLTAEGPDGSWAGRIVREDDGPIELHLAPPPEPASVLSLELAGDHDGLSVDLVVNGTSRPSLLLEPGAPLEIDRLEAGQWLLSLRSDSDWLARRQPLTLGARGRLRFQLPGPAPARQ